MHIHGLTAYTLAEWKSSIYYKTIEQDLFINTGETASAVRWLKVVATGKFPGCLCGRG